MTDVQGDAVDALDAFVAARRGRRDAFVWWVGLPLFLFYAASFGRSLHLVPAAIAMPAMRPTTVVNLVVLLLGLVATGAYVFRRPWSRWGILVAAVVTIAAPILGILVTGVHVGFLLEVIVGSVTVVGLVLCGVLVLAWRSPLNRLAFGLEVPRPRLEAAWRAYRENRLARVALGLSIPAAVVPLMFVPVTPVVLTAWQRSRGSTGRRGGTVLVALGLCVAGCAVTVLAVVYGIHARR